MRLQYIAILLLGTIGAPVHAQQVGDFTVWSGFSTFGASFEGGYQIAPDWRARGGWMGGVNLNETETEDGNTYDIDADLGAFTMMLDYSPMDADWRVSGGLLFSRTSIETAITATSDNPIEYDGQSFASGNVTSVAEFDRSVSPVITAGYDYPFGDNWVFSSEIGAVLIGGLDIVVTGDSAALQDAIDNDPDVAEGRADASDLSFYPYINVAVGYRF
jgi:hypothetical protein